MAIFKYRIRDLDEDELFRLLPYVVRITDPGGAIYSYFYALAKNHNFLAKKLRELPGLQDPTVSAAFQVKDFPESADDYAEYKILLANRMEQTEYGRYLAAKIPQLIKASQFETQVLNLLGQAVGNKFYARYVAIANRKLIQTAIIRHHIKGTHWSVYTLGRILGFIELRVTELWSRFSITDPGDVSSVRNDGDFSDTPEQYPHWPQNGVYQTSGSLDVAHDRKSGIGTIDALIGPAAYETPQLPAGTVGYDPFVVDDADGLTVAFPQVTASATSQRHFAALINGHNPFGRFLTNTVTSHKLTTGVYYLSGGDPIRKSRTFIPTAGAVIQQIVNVTGTTGTTMVITVVSTTGYLAGDLIRLIGSPFDGEYRVFSLSATTLTVPFYGEVPGGPSTGVVVSAGGVVEFEALTWGSFGNSVSVRVSVDVRGTRRLELSGPTSRIKYKSSYFAITTAVDAGVFASLFRPIPVEPNIWGTIDDPDLVASTSFDILDATIVSGNRERVRIKLAGAGTSTILLNSVIEINGISGLDGFRRVRLVTSPTEFEVRSSPGLPHTYSDLNFPPVPPYPTVKLGRVAGDYPVAGSRDGSRRLSNPDVDYQINYAIYFELLATLRDLFADLRPITRTLREEHFGFLINDQVRYAPVLVIDLVILQSPNGQLWKLDVGTTSFGHTVKWVAIDPGPTPTVVKQPDRLRSDRTYQWAIDNDGVFFTLYTTGNVDLVRISSIDGEFTGFVTLRQSILIATTNSSEESVENIHPDSNISVENDLNRVVDRPLERVRPYMGEYADSEDLPRPQFAFQSGPEDDLLMFVNIVDAIATHRTDGWLGSDDGARYDLQTPDVAWDYTQDGVYIGRDIRNRATGSLPAIIEPVPTGSTLRNDGLYSKYPVEFLDSHGLVVWRERITNQLMMSEYTMDSPNVNVGATRVDTFLNFDGRTEGDPDLNQQGLGCTPNDQSGNPEIEPWLPARYSDENLISHYTAATGNGVTATFTLTGQAPPLGSKFTVINGPYAGTHTVSRISVDAPWELDFLSAVSVPDAGALWWEVARPQVWPTSGLGDQFTFLITATAGATYRVLDISADGLTTNVIGYGALVANVELLVSVTSANGAIPFGFVQLEVSGTGAATVQYGRPEGAQPIFTVTDGSALMWGGGCHDAVELTILDAGETYTDYVYGNESSYDPLLSPLYSEPMTWRGGDWPNPADQNLTDHNGFPITDHNGFPIIIQ